MNSKALTAACNDFYTKIPHDFGMKKPPLINTVAMLQKKAEMMEALSDIKITLRVLKENVKQVNPLDAHYSFLNCDIQAVHKDCEESKLITQAVENTHAPTHSELTVIVDQIYKINRHDEEKSFRKRLPNRMLLWHGSPITNFVGILSQGLRIAPPEAPITGHMFGKGGKKACADEA